MIDSNIVAAKAISVQEEEAEPDEPGVDRESVADLSPLLRLMADFSAVPGFTVDGKYVASFAQRITVSEAEVALRSLAVRREVPGIPASWASVPANKVTEYLDFFWEPEIEGDPPILEEHPPHAPMRELIDAAIAELSEKERPLTDQERESLRHNLKKRRANDATLVELWESAGNRPNAMPGGPEGHEAVRAEARLFFYLLSDLDLSWREAKAALTICWAENYVKDWMRRHTRNRSGPVGARTEVLARQPPESMFASNIASWPPPISEDAFYGLAGQFVRIVEPHTEADPKFLLLMFLAYAGNVLDRKYYVMAGGDRHYTNLYLCGVGATSSGRKGSTTGPVELFFRESDRAPGLGNMLPGLSSGEGLIWTIRDEVWGKQYNKKTRETEDVLLHEGVADKRLIVNLGEFMGALQVMRRQGNTLSPVVRAAWESGVLVSPTKNSPARATGAHVTIVGMISKEELLRAIEETDADNGLLNRFLWCCCRRSKTLPEGGRLWQVVESPAWRRLQEDFNRIGLLPSGRLERNEDAADIWGRDSHPDRGVYAELSRERYGLAGAATARAHAQVLRLSLLYAVLDRAPEIRPEHLDAALAVWRYCEDSARYIFGDALGDPTADAVIKALRAAQHGLTRTDIRDHFHRKKQEGEITRALFLLHQKGLARFERQETAGRPVERWFATSGTVAATKG